MTQKSKIIITTLLIILTIGCSTSNKVGERELAFKKYLETRNIDIQKLNDSNYTDYYLEFLNDEKKEIISKNHDLKVNKVYVYQGDNKTFTFCVFSEDGYLYMGEAYKKGGMLLDEPKDGKIEIKNSIELNFLGFFELEDNIIKISRHEKIPRGEKNQSDWGNIKNDTITLTKMYNTKKYGYNKKWLAKTHKINFKLLYQSDLIVTKSKNQVNSDAFRIQGSFNLEGKLEEDQTLELMENVKY